MGFNSVTITPTLDTSAYADGDVLFAGTELKMPHRNCKLLSVQAVWDDTEAASEHVGLYFFAENNTPTDRDWETRRHHLRMQRCLRLEL